MEDTGEDAKLTHIVCYGGVLACLLTLLLITALVISAMALDVKSRAAYPADDVLREAAIASFASFSRWHSAFAVLILVPALFIVAFSLLCALQAGGIESGHSRRIWFRVAKAVLLAVVLLVRSTLGKIYFGHLLSLNYWLLTPPGGYAADAVVAKGQVVGAGIFSAYIVLHGVLLPLFAVILVILMWPDFYWPIARPEPEVKTKRLKLSDPREL